MTTEPTTCPTCGAPVRIVGHTTLHYEPVPSNTAAAPGLTVTTLGHNTNPLQPIEESLALSIEATAARLAQELADARADLRDAGDEVARLRRLLIKLVHAGRALHEDILPHNGGGMWSDAHGAFVAALNAVGAEDLEAGDGNG